LVKGAAFSLAGAVLTFFGFIHGEAIGIGQAPAVAFSYLAVAGLLFGCARYADAPIMMAARDELEPAE
jgi:AGZA family xanthine/uracil permease-like MFS transporter